MKASVVQLLLICICLLFHPMFVFCYSSIQRNNHPLTTRLGVGNETDRMALLAIKAKIHHDPNSVMSTWNVSIHFCAWYGVSCGVPRHPQRVTRLNMSSQGLVGSISRHIGNLSFLREIILSSNSFNLEIPPEIGRLRRLQVLRLYNNSLTGSIPATISYCFNLTFINFGNNKLTGQIPTELGFLSKLQIFVLEKNMLTGEIPSSFGNLTSLEALASSGNNLVGNIPTSLGQLKRLYFLSLGTNRLSGTLPPSFYNLSSIKILSFTENHLRGSIPSYLIDAFPNLQHFGIGGNELTGVIPSSISNATSLVTFEVAMNYFFGQVPSLQKLFNLEFFTIGGNQLGTGKNEELRFVSDLINATQLKRLEINDNNFRGTLPASISNLSAINLEDLKVGANQLHGSIPSSIGNLVNLQNLYMGESSFTGSIPTSIGKLSRMVELDFSNNKLSGNIPSHVGNLTRLTTLKLDRNNLHGNIPLRLGECHRLLELDLSQNNLAGRIPQQLLSGLLSSVLLNLSRNNFVGYVPVEIGKMKTLGRLDVSNNMLSGELYSLGSCESLELLYLQGNFFEGIIPSSMKELRGLQDLDLSRNNLSGDIPKFLEDLENLKSLNLSYNDFVGEVPIKGVFKNASAISVVGNTGLCGGIVDLQIPDCKSTNSKQGGLSRRKKIMISLVSGFTLLGFAIILSFFFLCKKKKEAVVHVVNNLGNSAMVQVSYAALLKATDKFSSSNLIGTGAFGSVYKGILEDDRVVVAVKVLNMLHRGASKSFVAECEALRNIRHRNLVKIITACSSVDFLGNDFKALIYEFMDNGSLDEWLHTSARSEEVTNAPKVLNLVQRLDISIDVSCALDYLHNHCETPIVHCDLKPSNVLLDEKMTGHVSDFGLARFLSKSTDNVSGNQSSSIGVRGSVGYAAPEYGMGSEVSINGDIYSFGILLLEMFTGKRPTDHIFSDGLTLHNFVKTTPPERVLEIADRLLLQGISDVSEGASQSSVRPEKVEESLNLIFEIGIACSTENPTNRKDMSDVISELHSIRVNLLG